MITLAVDAMGGDVGLDVTAPAAAAFLNRQPDARLLMVGHQEQVQAALASAGAPLDRIEIVHATEVVAMDEAPQHALKNKKDSSMRIDLGANVDCSAEQLWQFAVLGSELFNALHPQKQPARVGLLNIGSEDIKGTEVVKQAFGLLKNSSLNFIGNVESNEIFSGGVDVVVADGFVGNIALKTMEGTVKFIGGAIKEELNRNWLTKLGALGALPALGGFKKRLDPRRFNGAIFLGLRGVVIKSHGGTDAVGFAYALDEAYHEAQSNSLERIAAGVAQRFATAEASDGQPQ